MRARSTSARDTLAGAALIVAVVAGCRDPSAGSPTVESRTPAPVGSPTMAAVSPVPSASDGPDTEPAPDRAIGRWTAAAPMLRGRAGFSAVLLGDGTVLAVGDDFGCQPGPAVEGSRQAERYDPLTDAWVEVDSLDEPRKEPAAVALGDGTALLAGGIDSRDFPMATTTIFSPEIGTWSEGPPLGHAMSRPTAARLPDGGALIAFVPNAGGTAIERYDPASGSLRPTAPLPPTLSVLRLHALQDGQVLAEAMDDGGVEQVPAYLLYLPGEDAWLRIDSPTSFLPTIAPLPDGTALALAGTNGGGIQGGDGRFMNLVERLDPDLGRWFPVAPLPSIRLEAQIAALPDGRLLVAGGATGFVDDPDTTVHATSDVYDPAIDRWSPAADLLEARYGGHAVVLGDGSVLVFGGAAVTNTEGEVPWCPVPLSSVERLLPG
jgi:hypothetical protein